MEWCEDLQSIRCFPMDGIYDAFPVRRLGIRYAFSMPNRPRFAHLLLLPFLWQWRMAFLPPHSANRHDAGCRSAGVDYLRDKLSTQPHSEPTMPLINCPACDRQISAEAEACPQCGHPNRREAPAAAGPKCYACAAPATTRCQSCGKLSCPEHLQSIYLTGGHGYELRCDSCYWSAKGRNVFLIIAVFAILFVAAILWFAVR